jgi:hypothetical protein
VSLSETFTLSNIPEPKITPASEELVSQVINDLKITNDSKDIDSSVSTLQASQSTQSITSITQSIVQGIIIRETPKQKRRKLADFSLHENLQSLIMSRFTSVNEKEVETRDEFKIDEGNC